MIASHVAHYRKMFGKVKTVSTNYTLPHTIKEALNEYADANKISRSMVLAMAVSEFLNSHAQDSGYVADFIEPRRAMLHVRVGNESFNPTPEDLNEIAALFKSQGDSMVITSNQVVVEQFEIPRGPLEVRVQSAADKECDHE